MIQDGNPQADRLQAPPRPCMTTDIAFEHQGHWHGTAIHRPASEPGGLSCGSREDRPAETSGEEEARGESEESSELGRFFVLQSQTGSRSGCVGGL